MDALHLIKRYVWRGRSIAKTLAGVNYHRYPQVVGKGLVPNALEGYFNDLTLKTLWTGPVDDDGIIMLTADSSTQFYFPISVFQKGLGHWDRWLLGGKRTEAEREKFLAHADWAVRHQQANGGWICWREIQRDTASEYSAMAQGQGISLLARAYSVSGDDRYARAAEQAYLMLADVDSAVAVSRSADGGVVLEEYPGSSLPGVLNGWLFAIWGVNDYAILTGTSDARAFLHTCLASIAKKLPLYDAKFWSYYDQAAHFASPFYHSLHVHQLDAFTCSFPEFGMVFGQYRDVFREQQNHILNRARAIMVKFRERVFDTHSGEIV